MSWPQSIVDLRTWRVDSLKGEKMYDQLRRTHTEIRAAAAVVYAKQSYKFKTMLAENPKRALSAGFGFAIRGQIGEDGEPHPRAAAKFVKFANVHIKKFNEYIPYLKGLTKIYEIGVGPGYLFRILMDVYGIDMAGCDLPYEENVISSEVRRELGLLPYVQAHKVVPGKEIPIPTGTQAVISFWTGFNTNWSVKDYGWFIDHCQSKLTGQKVIILKLNQAGFLDREGVCEFLATRAEFPRGIDDAFCIIRPHKTLSDRSFSASWSLLTR